ncbi:MAG: hypothetical protein ACRCV9_07125 [Burkholderiaceae bacterium]
MSKPEFALAGVNINAGLGEMTVELVSGWTVADASEAVAQGLVPVRTTWDRIQGLLYQPVTHDQFMALSA